MKKHFNIAICQLKVIDNKESNINRALEMIKKASKNADLIILPEMFNCPYDNSKFKEYAEERENSETLNAISEASKENNVYVVAGSIPELENDEIYNSSFIFDNKGEIIDYYRKMHLFDIDTPTIKFKESDTISAGNRIGIFDTPFTKIGIAICYDMRFPELLRIMALKGVNLIIVPGAFNMTTGPAHWELLVRGRSVDNQVFMAAASPARNEELSYVAYGNSMITDPWGNILARASENEEIIYADINLDNINRVRRELTVLKNRRDDIYSLIEK